MASGSSWPPEVPPPWTPAPPPAQPTYPPIPIVYESAPARDDVMEKLLEQRTVIVGGTLDTTSATDAAARLMLLDGTGDDSITVLFSCPDGDVVAAMALADTVELVGVEVRAVANGTIGGPAVLPFAVASQRLAHPHATFRLTEPALALEGRASDIARDAERQAELLHDFHRRLARATGQPVDTIAADLRARRFLSAADAKTYGLVNEIATKRHLRTV